MADPMRHNRTIAGQVIIPAEFSRMCRHHARSTVTRAARRGRVVLTRDGKVDLSNPTNSLYLREALTSCAIRAAPGIEAIKTKLQNKEDF